MAQYQKSARSHSALDITTEGKKQELSEQETRHWLTHFQEDLMQLNHTHRCFFLQQRFSHFPNTLSCLSINILVSNF